jgi:hypothetical protein
MSLDATPPSGSNVSPRRLELILNPEDGSLQTAPLLNVILATTDSLHQDLYNMAHGDIHVTSAQPPPGAEDNDEDGDAFMAEPQGRSEKMSNLSFAQRRHELGWRLASHARAVQHVASLCAAAATSEFSQATEISTRSLQHARTAWVQADEAQDALYFFHARLFPSRLPPHDVYGALDVLLLKYWPDLPSDLRLLVDRYDASVEKKWTSGEVAERWQMAVRSKLLLGEVGWLKRQRGPHPNMSPPISPLSQQHVPPLASLHVPWRISMRGGIVRLTHGRPKTFLENGTTKTLHPLEAILTVLTTNTSNVQDALNAEDSHNTRDPDKIPPPDSEWTLVSVEVHVQAKTGQSNHQLDTTNKQRFNMHRLCALAMAREEARARKARQEWQEKKDQDEKGENDATPPSSPITISNTERLEECVARPLNALFQVAHYFSLSWQLEVLSAQAQAMRKGVWGGSSGIGMPTAGRRMSSVTQSSVMSSSGNNTPAMPSYGSSIVVTPVQFFENRSILGIVSISFWQIDDRYGPPCMGDLQDEEDEEYEDTIDMDNKHRGRRKSSTSSAADSLSTVGRSINDPSVTNQLTLSIRAEPNVGIRVSLSGAESIMEFATDQPHIRSTIRELLEATSNPFSLSASEALLAATRLCAERKCHAMVEVLPQHLPSWISLRVEKGSIDVATKIRYFTGEQQSTPDRDPVVLFRLACDSRTGSFVPTFSRSTPLLQYMACNDSRAASDTTILRAANMAKVRRSGTSARSAGASFGSGRAVRDAFESLSRSMNVLGQRTGVGGAWRDHNKESAKLRLRAIQLACTDVKVSLMTCCGMAALYGLSAVCYGVATGVQASADMSGGKLDLTSAEFLDAVDNGGVHPNIPFLPTPPLTVLIDQKLVENSSWTRDGDRVKETYTVQQLFGACCSVDEAHGVMLYGADIRVRLESPSSILTRTGFAFTRFAKVSEGDGSTSNEPPAKRAKNDSNANGKTKFKDLMDEMEYFAEIVSDTIELAENCGIMNGCDDPAIGVAVP